MNAERYRQIDALAEAALRVEASSRQEFLQRACGSDQELLEQVSKLLRGYATAGDFLDEPAFEAWARDMAAESAHPSLAGCRVGRYVIASRLGAGGIGEVWLAQDTELAREVALKFLSPELAGDSDQARRFRQEARAASSLNHINLVTIFDIGEFEGRQFIAQEYIRGETVRDTLASRADERRECCRYRWPDCEGTQRGSRRRNCPSRYQAGKHHDPSRRRGEDCGLRNRAVHR